VTFRKGDNDLVLKIQNGSSDWAFSCRPMSPAALTEKLIASVQTGHLDPVTMLLEHGVDVNDKVGPGLTALHMARIAGRPDTVEFLKSKGANPDVPMPPQGEITDWLFERVIRKDYPGAAVLVARAGETLYQNGYGYANVENRVDVTPETKFRIGSVSKQFIAVAIMKLQEAGKLSVQDKLSKFIPDFPRGDEVTLHHLLTHTSGMHSYTNKPDFLKTVASEITPRELVDAIKKDPFDFDPGEKQDYCNSGYFLLGYIVEKFSGESLDVYLKETLFEPLGMKNTGIHHWSLILDHEATGYTFEGGQVKKALDWDMSRAGGAGALYSTVGDLQRWNEAIFGGKVLSPASMQAAFAPARLNNGEIAKAVAPGGYGYGWDLGKLRGLVSIAHGGGLHGFSSYAMHLPEKQLTVTVLLNCLPAVPGLSSSGYARNIAEVFLYEEMAEQISLVRDETVDPKIYDDYVGRYDYGNSMVLAITREGDRLLAQLTGQGQAEILPRSEREFFWKEVDTRIRFVRNEEGVVTGAVHRQGGRTLEVRRLKDEKVANLDPALYDMYAGDYELEQVGTITIVNEDGRLWGRLGSQPRFEMFPRTETEFFLKIVQASISFARGPDGQVTGLTLQQSGRALPGKKKTD
jgi:CubicO group peptidase (beta-lactamase class C family)